MSFYEAPNMYGYESLADSNKGISADLTGLHSSTMAAPLDYSMRTGVPISYDSLSLHPQGGSSWRRPPSDVPLQQGKFFVSQSGGGPLRDEMIFSKIPKNSMFVFSKNVSSPLCCPATHATSTGCVCTTQQQRDYIGLYRGGNVDGPSNPPV